MTPQQKANYLLSLMPITSCINVCDKMIAADMMPEYYELVKKELLNNENKFGY